VKGWMLGRSVAVVMLWSGWFSFLSGLLALGRLPICFENNVLRMSEVVSWPPFWVVVAGPARWFGEKIGVALVLGAGVGVCGSCGCVVRLDIVAWCLLLCCCFYLRPWSWRVH
jgi:hypothetical protein